MAVAGEAPKDAVRTQVHSLQRSAALEEAGLRRECGNRRPECRIETAGLGTCGGIEYLPHGGGPVSHVQKAVRINRCSPAASAAPSRIVPEGGSREVEFIHLTGIRDENPVAGYRRRTVISIRYCGSPYHVAVRFIDCIKSPSRSGASDINDAIDRDRRRTERVLAEQLGSTSRLTRPSIEGSQQHIEIHYQYHAISITLTRPSHSPSQY